MARLARQSCPAMPDPSRLARLPSEAFCELVTNSGIPSGNQKWQWNMDYLSVIFLISPNEPSIHRAFSIAMLDLPEGNSSIL